MGSWFCRCEEQLRNENKLKQTVGPLFTSKLRTLAYLDLDT